MQTGSHCSTDNERKAKQDLEMSMTTAVRLSHFDIISCVYTEFPSERPLQGCSIISASLYLFPSIALLLPSHIPPGGASRQHYPKHRLKPYTFLMGCGTGTQVARPELEISGQVTGLWV